MPTTDPSPGARTVDVTRAGPGGRAAAEDGVAVEEPLEIRVAGETLAITMRTPGHDRELALGFLLAEGVIAALDDVGSVAHCGRTGDAARFNAIDVIPAPGARLALPGERVRRGTLSTSACGVCGRQTIDDLLARCAASQAGDGDLGPRMSRAALARAVATLRDRQALFARTGGCHGASLVDMQGTHIATYEDVGRHNAVDKLVGASLLAGRLPLTEYALVVSGRTSFEIVQKAVVAGVPIVLGVSAASSLALDVARRAGVTLAGFVRDEDMVLYANAGRIT